MAISPERRQYLADLANDEWVDRFDHDGPNGDARYEAMSQAMGRECARFAREATNSEELHVFADLWNWDGGNETMLAVTRNPACDAGTALLIYWRNSPEYYAEFGAAEEVQEYNREGYALFAEVGARLLAGEFGPPRIRYDPRAEGMVTGRMAPGRELPPALYEPVGRQPTDTDEP